MDPHSRLGGCAGIITPQSHTPTEAVAIMTGATTLQGRAAARPLRPRGAADPRRARAWP